MKIRTRCIGKNIIEMTVESQYTAVVEDITDLKGKVNPQFIQDLEDIIFELKTHNEKFE